MARRNISSLGSRLRPIGFALAVGFCSVSLAAESPPDYETALNQLEAADQVTPELLDAVITLKSQADDIPEPTARMMVLRELAKRFSAQKRYLESSSLLGQALALAQKLEDPDQLIPLYIEHARATQSAGSRSRALPSAESAWALASRLQRTNEQLEAGLLLATFLYPIGKRDRPAEILDLLSTLPDVDQLQIKLKRAELFTGGSSGERIAHWTAVLELARQKSARPIEARALNQLGHLHRQEGDTDLALQYFRQADTVAPDEPRTSVLWESYGKALAAVGESDQAIAALIAALAKTSSDGDWGHTSELHAAIASVHFDAGNLASAYASQSEALKTLQQGSAPSRFPSIKMLPISPVEVDQEAANIAIVRNALREAKLDRTRLRQHLAIGSTALAVMLAAVLGLAYAYKRRNAQALAISRDAAELRAERTHWQMLRYQLNPHFLFNALTSLSGLVTIDPTATRTAIGRLSQFCRLALERTSDDLRTLQEEVNLLSAFLDVEKVGLGDRLSIHWEISPRASSRLLPPLLLQPLVENALKYGSETSGDQMQIRISAQIDESNDDLILEVANTGTWVDNINVSPRRRDHIGLTNVRERLARFAPAPDAFRTETSPGWVHVRITLPDLHDHVLVLGNST